MRLDLVIPTVGRPSLARLLAALGRELPDSPPPIVVDDRPLARRTAALGGGLAARLVGGPARGPAAARNAGWRATSAEWVAFLDDDVVPEPGWGDCLHEDLAGLPDGVVASQGRIRVPLPRWRRPTDWERNVAGLESARWATADMAYRRRALAAVGGFDERFPCAYREDTDLGLRLVAAGGEIVRGSRRVVHPVPPADRWVSLRKQAGNADDVLMRAIHGRRWREAAGAPSGRRGRHLATAAAGAAAVGGLALGARRAALAGAAGWLAGTAELAAARIAPGPRSADEIATMVATSPPMPFAAAAWTLAGIARVPLALARGGPRPARPPAAVLLDRDGTLVADVPYNDDPGRVEPMPGAREALRRLRDAGIPTAVVSNQSGIGRGLVSAEQVEAVNRRIEELLGPLGPWLWCPHAPEEGCRCRKPAPGLVLRAAELLAVEPGRCAVVGDIGADVEAARAAGARSVLVPTPRTRAAELRMAPEAAPTLDAAVELLLMGGDR